MTRTTIIVSLLIGLIAVNVFSAIDSTTVRPVKLISGCQLDLNGDQIADIAELIETERGRELVMLLRTDSGYTAFTFPDTLSTDFELSCVQGELIQGNTDGGEMVERKTTGSYLILAQPESAAFAYFWNGNTFELVWISD
jgi:hypothetical protein